MIAYTQLNNAISSTISWTNEEQQSFFEMLRIKKYKTGECLVKKGATCNDIFFINKGLLGNIVEDKNGNDFPVHFTFENDLVSNFIGFLNDTYKLSHLVALEDAECVVIPQTALRWMYTNIKEGNKFGRIQQERILLLLIKRQRLNYTSHPLERFKLMKEIYPGIEKHISQRMISSFLKIDQSYFCRLKTAIEKNDL